VTNQRTWVDEEIVEEESELRSDEFCPSCHADSRSGWNGKVCERRIVEEATGRERLCGYTHFRLRVKPMASLLSTCFRDGVVIVDEATMMKGDEAKRSLAIRGIQARHKLCETGTPVKNFIPDAFWLLWWCLGDSSKAFPYGWQGGKTKFENDFAVIEARLKEGKRANRKVLPEVTNLSMLWRLLCSSLIRRTKEETGEPIVERRFHITEVPLGLEQAKFQRKWGQGFPSFFTQKNPDHALVRAGLVELWAPMIGLQAKLDYAATMPVADPDWRWTGVDVSNWTPANLKTVELAMALAKQGRKVLIGSNLRAGARFIAEALCEKGVRAEHLLDSSDNTAGPAKRGEIVHRFQKDKTQVLVAGIKAVRYGHNLDASSAVIVHGLEWDYEAFAQFIARVHRLTSPRTVDVYVIVPTGTLTQRKWDILNQKGDAAALALDGRITERKEERTNERDVVNEFVAAGLPAGDDGIDEDVIYATFRSLPHLVRYEIPDGLLGDTGDDHGTPDPSVLGMLTEKRSLAVAGETITVKGIGAVKVAFDLPLAERFIQQDTGQSSLFAFADDELVPYTTADDEEPEEA
jgi:hypothetical protein